MKTTFERGIEQGIERGSSAGSSAGSSGIERGIEQGIEQGIIQGERRSALRQMEAKFGPLSSAVKRQVDALSQEALAQLQLDLLRRKR